MDLSKEYPKEEFAAIVTSIRTVLYAFKDDTNATDEDIVKIELASLMNYAVSCNFSPQHIKEIFQEGLSEYVKHSKII